MPHTDPGNILLLEPRGALVGTQVLTEAETRALVMTALLGYESCGATAEGVADTLGVDTRTTASLHTKLTREYRRLAIGPAALQAAR